MAVPEDLVLLGYVSGAFGVQGWLRIRPFSPEAEALLGARTWWLDKPELRDVDVMQAKAHGDEIVARLVGVADRDAAEALKGASVQVRRSHFPALDDDEFYWVDLIGLDVVNERGEALGVVADMMDNGAHPILRVAPPAAEDGKPRPEMLIPFVDHFVKAVDQAERRITVDWEADY
jgi:16S rRNA processing protein RimM